MRRTVTLLTFGCATMYGSQAVELSGSGPLSCLVMGCVCRVFWTQYEMTKVGEQLLNIWYFAQPMLFGLVGAEIIFVNVDAEIVGIAAVILGGGLAFRFAVSFLSVTLNHDFNFSEKLFVAIAWMPKATVQAAIGLVALDTARRQEVVNAVHVEQGEKILTMAVLAILVTAPIGAVLISLCGPRLLSVKEKEESREEEEVEVTVSTLQERPILTIDGEKIVDRTVIEERRHSLV